jgi:hypothetical protein
MNMITQILFIVSLAVNVYLLFKIEKVKEKNKDLIAKGSAMLGYIEMLNKKKN